MPSLFEARARQALQQRIDRLTPDRQPLWGRLSAPRMLMHIGDQMRQAIGELEVAPVPGAEIKQLIERCASRGPELAWARSPVFGRISREDWGVLCHRHLDHHLRQFGV